MLKEEMSRTVSQAFSELLKVSDYVCGNQQLNDGSVCLAKQQLVKKTAVLMLYLRKFHGYVDQQPVPPVADRLLEACLEQAHSASMDLQITESQSGQFLLSSALDDCDDSLEYDDNDAVQVDLQEGNNIHGSLNFDFHLTNNVPGSLDLHGGSDPHEVSSVPGSLDLHGGSDPHEVSSVPGSLDLHGGSDPLEVSSVPGSLDLHGGSHPHEVSNMPGSLDLHGGSDPHEVSSVPGSLDLHGGSDPLEVSSVPGSLDLHGGSHPHEVSNMPTSSEHCRGKGVFESKSFTCDNDDTNMESSDSEEDAAKYVNMSKAAKERAIQRFQVEQWRLYEKVRIRP